VAALIRQESEFNPKALSRARAYGLTQVLPSTGREVSRKLKMRRFNAAMLYQPDVNLRIGTWYLRAMLDQLQGRWEPTLASYNAGKSRVVNWLRWSDFREPAEFIESIPFNETRNYVQSVLRNADIYRRLYAPKTVALK
jgi:soluble lytic murein transglycosylase